MTSFKMTVRDDCAVSAWNSHPCTLGIKALAPQVAWGSRDEGESQLLDRNLLSIPHDRLPASEIKPTFLSTNLAS